MAGNGVEMRRCGHIRTNGTQCGSPAQRGKKKCYQHLRVKVERVTVRGGDGKASEIVVPLLEDAHSIQAMVRQVMVLMLRGRIDGQMSGRLLYGLQIASANLGKMKEEAPRPAQVVVDVERVGETPLGMTPWSWKPGGHELEEVEDKIVARTKRAIVQEWENETRAEENERMKAQLTQITKRADDCSDKLHECIARENLDVDRLKEKIKRVKNLVEEVADANEHKCTISSLPMDEEIRAKLGKTRKLRQAYASQAEGGWGSWGN